ncbi:MAG: 2-oxoacid:ferredoxin oxidoreductase subunit beta [Planctomycetes bacterium]|nr:2-oxoacid:ferredoxin oxidoreductase subunit beta [Planctomycetota bacterium]
MVDVIDPKPLTKKDYASDQEVRWCPGCGDYAILNAVQKFFADTGRDRANTVFVSGIGCSSRFPYYMETYGFHTIHGRAAAVATGLKVANPGLEVWMVTGDGDALSIGGNHTAHLLRRNLDLNVLLFNNEIYGLTKGQYSPTSPIGTVKKSTPMGSVDRPFEPVQFALGAQATFVARTIDNDQAHMAKVLEAAAAHKGTSLVEILQNCVIFNKDFYSADVDKQVRADRTIDLVPGRKLVYGKDGQLGLRFRLSAEQGFRVERCAAAEADVWNPAQPSASAAFLLAGMHADPELPLPVGIFRAVAAPCYEDGVNAQVTDAIAKRKPGVLRDLVYAGEIWTVG